MRVHTGIVTEVATVIMFTDVDAAAPCAADVDYFGLRCGMIGYVLATEKVQTISCLKSRSAGLSYPNIKV